MANAMTNDWVAIAQRKQADRRALLSQYIEVKADHDGTAPHDLAAKLLTAVELAIVQLPATDLAKEIANKTYSAVQVVTAYIKSAVIAQHVTNCLTEISFEHGLRTAAELDEALKRTGSTVGPLHGVPVSIKDHIDVEGLDGASGFVGWCYKNVADKDACIVRCLREAGAVVYCKTANPQSLLAIETNNNIYGRTTNPYNSKHSAGGSTGGEGALLSLRGSPLGVGTDIAGSIRVPATWNGVYGLRPSVGRLPHTGLQGPSGGMDAILGVVGPLARTAQDLDLFCSAVLGRQPWYYEAQLINKPWRSLNHEPRRLTIAIMREDGMVAPHPPVAAALEEAAERLKAAGHEVVNWEAVRAAESDDLTWRLFLQDKGDEYRDYLALSGEPPVPTIKWLLEERAPKEILDHPYKLWRLVQMREKLRQDGVDQWSAYPKLDAILCPGAATLAPLHDTSRHWGYTSMWNVLDWPAVSFPAKTPEKLKSYPPHPPRSSLEEQVFGQWDPDVYQGLPVGLQLVGRRLEEEKLLEDLHLVEKALA